MVFYQRTLETLVFVNNMINTMNNIRTTPYLTPMEKFEQRYKDQHGNKQSNYKIKLERLISQYELHLSNLKFTTDLLQQYFSHIDILKESEDVIKEYKEELKKDTSMLKGKEEITETKEETTKELDEIKKENKRLRLLAVGITIFLLGTGYLLSLKGKDNPDLMKSIYHMKH